MLHNDAVQHGAGEQPSASTPKTSQNPVRASTAARLKIPSHSQADRRQENGASTGPRAGDNDTLPICIRDKHSPPPKLATHDVATHATAQRLLHHDALTTGQSLAHMYQQEPARYHSFGNGDVQAFSVFGPELDTVQKQLRDVQQHQPFSATQNLQHGQPLTHMYQQEPTRYHSLGNGDVQAFSVFGPELDTVQKQLRDAQQKQPFLATQNLQKAQPCHFLHYNHQDRNKRSTTSLLLCDTRGHGLHPLTKKSSPALSSGQKFFGLLGFNLSEIGAEIPTRSMGRGSRTNLAEKNGQHQKATGKFRIKSARRQTLWKAAANWLNFWPYSLGRKKEQAWNLPPSI